MEGLLKQGAKLLPGLAVFTAKPTKDKCRAVVCGNFAPKRENQIVYTSQADVTAIRAAVRLAAYKQWDVGSVDVKTAFLNAPLDSLGGSIILVRPPSVFVEANATPKGSVWRLHRALYGLREAPRA